MNPRDGSPFGETGDDLSGLDLDEVRRAYSCLQHDLRRYQDTFEAAPNAYLVTDVGGTIRDANGPASLMLGVEPGELVGGSVFEAIPPRSTRGVRSTLKSLTAPPMFSAPSLEATLDFSIVTRDNTTIPVHAHLRLRPPLTTGDSPLIYWLLRDMRPYRREESKRLEAAEQHAVSATREQLLGLMSHELRTPLTVIKGAASILARHGETLPDEERAAMVADIHDEAQRLENIVENMLILGNPQRRFPVQELDVPAVIERCVRRFASLHKELRLITRCEPGLPYAIGVASYLEQIVDNMLGNAARYNDSSSPITLQASSTPGEVQISVYDRGRGIPYEDIDQIFQPFYRGSNVPPNIRGMGLGLAVCERLATAMDGSMWIASGMDGGTVIGVSLPRLN